MPIQYRQYIAAFALPLTDLGFYSQELVQLIERALPSSRPPINKDSRIDGDNPIPTDISQHPRSYLILPTSVTEDCYQVIGRPTQRP